MADVHIDDDQTIASRFTRLPATTPKAGRGRTTPKARRGRAIFFSPNNTSVPVDDHHKEQHSTVKPPFRFPFEENRDVVAIVGTYRGIVLLHVHVELDTSDDTHETSWFSHIVLYNPSTGKSSRVSDPNSTLSSVYGFAYVFKTSTWSTSEITLPDTIFYEDKNVGTFLNGFLYWLASTKIVVLNVKKIDVVSEINLPNPHSYTNSHLGTLHGRLCMIPDTNNILDSGHDLWVMKEQGVEKSWSKVCSFTFGLGVDHITDHHYRILNIMDDGRILIVDSSSNLIIYNTSKRSYKKLNTSESVIDFRTVSGIEYVKSPASPSKLF
ncbi:F-box domain containing protein [Tanacetum coccineum]